MSAAVTKPPLNATTELAVDRTRLAYERTMMAWVRTAVSLITFGFTIQKFFQFMVESKLAVPRESLLGPRVFGMIMIAIGLFCLLLATISHRRDMKSLRTAYQGIKVSVAGVLALVISVLGVLAFLSALFRK